MRGQAGTFGPFRGDLCDLDDKSWLGETRAAAFQGLRTAMDTALALREQAGLRFVVAPVPALCGGTVRPVGSRYAVAVFPYLDGAGGRFGEALTAQERDELADMLAALHQSTPAAVQAPMSKIGLPRRATLDTALRAVRERWRGGPYAEPARALLTQSARQLRHLLQTFDQLAERVLAGASQHVITHGEPHPANIIKIGAERMLVDWDTAGLAPPERDLWMVADTGEELRRYTEATGRLVDPAAIAFYRLRWDLDDISIFVHRLRSGHRRTADAQHAWLSLTDTVARVTQERATPDTSPGTA